MDISSVTAQVALHVLKVLAILSDTTVKRSVLDREETYWKSEKRPHLRGDQEDYYLPQSFSKALLTAERRLTGRQYLAVDLSPTFLTKGAIDESFQQSGKQDSFRHTLNSSARTNES